MNNGTVKWFNSEKGYGSVSDCRSDRYRRFDQCICISVYALSIGLRDGADYDTGSV